MSKSIRTRTRYVMMSSDYSQQELKIVTQLCNDPQMFKVYQEGKDLYSEIAALSFHRSYEDCLEFYLDDQGHKTDKVNLEGSKYRKQAKSILLGILYGRGDKSIAEQLGCSLEEAKKIKQSVYSAFPSLAQFEQNSIKMAKSHGFVTTLWGRKRRLPELRLPYYDFHWVDSSRKDPIPMTLVEKYRKKLDESSWARRSKIIEEALNNDSLQIIQNGDKIAEAKRQCINSRVQGSASDMLKKAMVAIDTDQELKQLGFHLLIPVHDELIGECPLENAAACKERFTMLMNTCANDKLHIPISCDVVSSFAWSGEEINI